MTKQGKSGSGAGLGKGCRKKALKRKLRAPSKAKLLKRALREAEIAWISAVSRRAQGICEVHGQTCQDPVKQVDHFRSRRHGQTFLMVENGTYVCRTLNMHKAMGWNNAAEKIAFVVLKREGQTMVDLLLEKSRTPKKYTIEELEETKKRLNSMFHEQKEVA